MPKFGTKGLNMIYGLNMTRLHPSKIAKQCATDTVSVSVSADISVSVSLSVSADTDFYIGR